MSKYTIIINAKPYTVMAKNLEHAKLRALIASQKVYA
jgi:hypothetical protein